jgi:hypothetical protein
MPGTMTDTPESPQPGFPFTWVNKLGEHDYDIKDFGLMRALRRLASISC